MERTGAAPVAVVLAALKEELQPLRLHVRSAAGVRAGGVRYTRGTVAGCSVAVARMGLGPERAGAVSGTILDLERPRLAVLTGFAGALEPGWNPGDIVVASEIVEAPRAGGDSPEAAALPLATWGAPVDLLEIACRVRPAARAGTPGPRVAAARLVTVREVLRTPEAKKRTRQRTGAGAVDMEAGSVAREGTRRKIPVLCVRAILDDVDCELPFDFGKVLTPSGRPRPLKILGAVARRPGCVASLAGLRARARRAQESLGAYVPALLHELAAHFSPAE